MYECEIPTKPCIKQTLLHLPTEVWLLNCTHTHREIENALITVKNCNILQRVDSIQIISRHGIVKAETFRIESVV